ncbi:ABC transporter permease [Seohaeicola nanhaiensis]|uniref:ABC transporter permease n=1 Tax=Seohaeicola nanhaiensis TaxID=1387282 RepID=A0ABV9KBI3_9RHOB
MESLRPSRLLTAYFWLCAAFLLFPVVIVIPIAFGQSEFLRFPPEDPGLRWFREYFNNPVWVSATLVSLRVALAAASIATIAGLLAALGIDRSSERLRGPMTLAATLPILIPHIFVALGVFISAIRLGLTDSEIALSFAHAAVAQPFVVLMTGAALRQIDPTFERAARVLGAGPFRAFMAATFPSLLPAVVAAWIFAFFVSFDELIIAQFLMKGSETLPMRIWADLRLDISPTVAAVSAILIVVTAVALGGAELLRRRASRRLGN